MDNLDRMESDMLFIRIMICLTLGVIVIAACML